MKHWTTSEPMPMRHTQNIIFKVLNFFLRNSFRITRPTPTNFFSLKALTYIHFPTKGNTSRFSLEKTGQQEIRYFSYFGNHLLSLPTSLRIMIWSSGGSDIFILSAQENISLPETNKQKKEVGEELHESFLQKFLCSLITCSTQLL